MSNVLGTLFTNIANSIRSKTGGTDKISPSNFPAQIDSIIVGSGGEDYLVYATSVKFSDWNAFGKKEVVLNIPKVTNYSSFMNQSLGNSNQTVEHLTINGSLEGDITNVHLAWGATSVESTLKRLTLNCDFSNCSDFSYALQLLNALEVIDGIPIDFSSATDVRAFLSTSNQVLRELRVKQSTIKISIVFNMSTLSDETVQSIIDGLATVETAQNLILHDYVVAKLTTAQKQSIKNKNWTLNGKEISI